MDAIGGEYDDNNQALAICESQWDKSMTVNEKLLAAIKARGEKSEPWNRGILTADAYVRTLQECVGHDACQRYAATRHKSFDDVLRKAAKTLTYNNADMLSEEKLTDEYNNVPRGLELPKNTLMVVRYVTTASTKDRDGDILRTKGARPDPKRLLLYQHVHTLPVGKVLGTAEHTDKKLSTWGAIVDMNEVCHDAAVMIDNDMGRYSHGFRALEFEELKAEEGETTSPGGFDVKVFEIMEDSIVSVPSNVNAETEEVVLSLLDNGKLTSPLMKSMGAAIKERKTSVTSAGGLDLNLNINIKGDGNADVSGNGSGKAAGEGQGKGCACGTPKEADADAAKAEGSEDEKMTCPECGGKMEDGVCSKCGYKMEDKAAKTSPDQDNADAYNDMGPDLCPNCHTVSLDEDGKCPNCGFTRRSTNGDTKAAGGGKMYVYPGMISGSWEYTETKLREVAPGFLKNAGVLVDKETWVSVVATFADYAVLSVESYGPVDDSQTKYYRASWKTNDAGDPEFHGDVKEVEIQVAAQILEKLFSLASSKAGRVLSAANMKALKNIYEDLKELNEREEMTRGGKVICERCMKALEKMVGDMEEDEGKSVIKDAAAYFLARATKAQRDQMKNALETLDRIDQRAAITQEFKALVGAK